MKGRAKMILKHLTNCRMVAGLGSLLAHLLVAFPLIAAPPHQIFEDGFETGDTGNWGGQSDAKVTWQPSQVEATLLAGTQMALEVTLTPESDIGVVQIVAVPGLQDLVSVSPDWPIELLSGESVQVTIGVSADRDTSAGQYAGVIKVRDASSNTNRTYPRPLPVEIDIVEGNIVNGGDYSIVVPPNWTVGETPPSGAYWGLFPPGKDQGGPYDYVGDIAIREVPNPGGVPLEVFYQRGLDLDLFAVAASWEPLEFDSAQEAVLFRDVPGNFWAYIVAVRVGESVFEVTDFYDQVTEGLLVQVASSIEAE